MLTVLTFRHNPVKLELYKRFQAILIFCVGGESARVCVAVNIIQIIAAYLVFVMWEFYDKYAISPGLEEPDWAWFWLKEGFEDLLFFVILCAIMILWRPNLNNARFGF